MARRQFKVGLLALICLHIRGANLTPLDFRQLENTTGKNASVSVKVEQGEVMGVEEVTKDDINYFAFYAIPYAKPPVGELRFHAPQLPEPWTGVFYANRTEASCIQINMFSKELEGKEDCLVLNVYTPKMPSGAYNNSPMPVMVWIHGGAFEVGSGQRSFYGPDYFMTQDVVIVTINYRLGPLGFLNIKDSSVSANAGLKDQVAALKWVKRNIENFGGNPNMVTIFGESAGGASVHFHLLSPMSKGLFHRAISQSGSALNPWAFAKGSSAHERAVRLAVTMGCDTSTTLTMIDCLKKAPGRDLIKRSHNHTLSDEEIRHGVRFSFIPSSEQDAEGEEEVFLPQDPIDLIKSGKFSQVPYITGLNDQETIMFMPLFLKRNDLKNFALEFERIVPAELLTKPGKSSKRIAKKIKEFYFGAKEVSKNTIPNIVNLTTDTYFMNGIYNTVKMQSALSSSPIYFYQFTFDGELGIMKRGLGFGHMPGATHGDEIFYMFKTGFLDVDLSKETASVRTLFKMVKMWTNFAKTGDPSSEMGEMVNVKWTPATPTSMKYLKIDADLSMQVGLNANRIEFWDQIYKNFANDSYIESDSESDEDVTINEITNAGHSLIALPLLTIVVMHSLTRLL